MHSIKAVNDFVVKFANVNGTGSASANMLFSKSIFRMGIPVSPRNLFPSNIQGLPTWYEVRVSDAGYLGRRGDTVDMVVAMNPQSFQQDIDSLNPGGYIVYDNTRHIHKENYRTDINWIGLPLTETVAEHYTNPRQRQLFKNIVYVGALSALLDIDFEVLQGLIKDQFKGKEKLIEPNIKALNLGRDYALANFDCPLGMRLETRNANENTMMIDGNSAAGLGCIYGGATVAAWYPITPSTSLVEAFERYCKKLRVDENGQNKFAIIQAEDELSAMGMTLGANWNGARAFTATSGPGVSLMTEFLGLAYYAEIPAVLFDIQRGGPSTGMPTRTQQSDLLMAAYASHGDTKQVLLFPSEPGECFTMAADAFDLAERLQTPIIVMSDLELGMNEWITKNLEWDDSRTYDRGKVYSAQDLEKIEKFGRYLDVDGDGIGYRTIPGVHPTKGSYFTRGSSHNAMAAYSESSKDYVENMARLDKKFETAANLVHGPIIEKAETDTLYGVIYYGTTSLVMKEAMDELAEEGIHLDAMRIRAFPFCQEVFDFIENHQRIYVIEQNKDGQLRTLLINEGEIDPKKLIQKVHYDGMPITADFVFEAIQSDLQPEKAAEKEQVNS